MLKQKLATSYTLPNEFLRYAARSWRNKSLPLGHFHPPLNSADHSLELSDPLLTFNILIYRSEAQGAQSRDWINTIESHWAHYIRNLTLEEVLAFELGQLCLHRYSGCLSSVRLILNSTFRLSWGMILYTSEVHHNVQIIIITDFKGWSGNASSGIHNSWDYKIRNCNLGLSKTSLESHIFVFVDTTRCADEVRSIGGTGR